MRTGTKIGIAAAAMGLAAGVGGAAWAAIPDSSTGAVTGCYTAGGLQYLRVIDAQSGAGCALGEKKIVIGGKPTTLYTRIDGNLPADGHKVGVMVIPLPAGAWVVNGTVVLANSSASAQQVGCVQTVGEPQERLVAPGDTITVAVTGVVSSTGSGSAAVSCFDGGAGTVLVHGDMSATLTNATPVSSTIGS